MRKTVFLIPSLKTHSSAKVTFNFELSRCHKFPLTILFHCSSVPSNVMFKSVLQFYFWKVPLRCNTSIRGSHSSNYRWERWKNLCLGAGIYHRRLYLFQREIYSFCSSPDAHRCQRILFYQR